MKLRNICPGETESSSVCCGMIVDVQEKMQQQEEQNMEKNYPGWAQERQRRQSKE